MSVFVFYLETPDELLFLLLETLESALVVVQALIPAVGVFCRHFVCNLREIPLVEHGVN